MEENENKPVEEVSQTEEVSTESVQLSREEILAISRNENKNGDEREKNLYGKGLQIAYSIGVILIGVISLVNSIVVGKTPVELWIVYMGITAVWALYYGIKVGKHRPLYLTCGILCSIVCVLFTVYWILGLCGVIA